MLEPGQIFAHRYRVSRRIAEGGMGAIFEAEHTATERRVALKLLFPHIMSVASARKKFELEAKISARVNNRNIVEVLDAGFDEVTQSPFLVMELLDGQTLAQFVREHGPFSIDQALPLLEQIAAGLDAAHGYREANGTPKPIVHRDLKPENLFMAREHGVFSVKILDFGIAKVLGETGNVSQEVRGTPLYMAFEQVTAGALSPQTDVWALGLIAYYMFTGWHYWRSASAPSANVQSLFAEILSLPLEAPSVRMRQQNVSVQLPPAFDAWLLECIQREPARRFASAGAAVMALAHALGTSARARPRVDSKPAPAALFAATEAYDPTAAMPPAAMQREHAATASSLPGMASERLASHAPSPAIRRMPWLGAAGGAGALLLAGVTWLAFGRSGSPSEGPAPALAPSGAPGVEQLRASSASSAARAPSTLSLRPSLPAPEAAAKAPEAAEPTPFAPTPSAPEPQIRVAPRDEPMPDVAPVANEHSRSSPSSSTLPGAAPAAGTAASVSRPAAPAVSPAPPTVSPAPPTVSPALPAVSPAPPAVSPAPPAVSPALPAVSPPASSPHSTAPSERSTKKAPKNSDAYRIR